MLHSILIAIWYYFLTNFCYFDNCEVVSARLYQFLYLLKFEHFLTYLLAAYLFVINEIFAIILAFSALLSICVSRLSGDINLFKTIF